MDEPERDEHLETDDFLKWNELHTLGRIVVFLGAVCMISGGRSFLAAHQRRRRHADRSITLIVGFCRKCHHALWGLPETQCRQCGATFDPDDSGSFLRTTSTTWGWEGPLSLALLIVLIASGSASIDKPGGLAVAITLVVSAAGLAVSGIRTRKTGNAIWGAISLVLVVFLLLPAALLSAIPAQH